MSGFYIVNRHDRERVITLQRVAENTGSAVYLDDAAESKLPVPTGTMPYADIVTYDAAVKNLSTYTIQYDSGKGPLYISTQPVATTSAAAGDDVTLTVVASAGAGTKTYQWYKDGNKLTTANWGASAPTASLVNNAVTLKSIGDYWCVVTDGSNTQVTSDRARLDVTASTITVVGATQYSADGVAWASAIPNGVLVVDTPVSFYVRTLPSALAAPDDGNYIYQFNMATVGSGGLQLRNDMPNRAHITGKTPADQIGLTFSVNCKVKDSTGTEVTGTALTKAWA